MRCRFDRGLLHCSPPTARLAQQQLRVAPARIRPHPLNAPFEVEGIKVGSSGGARLWGLHAHARLLGSHCPRARLSSQQGV